MSCVIWSPAALQDVQRLYRFLASKNKTAAQRAVKSIRQVVQILSKQPGIGRPVEDMSPEFREWIIDFGESGYITLYRYDGQTAVVLTVRHQRETGYDVQK